MEMSATSAPRPWVRFWARALDISLYSLILTLFIPSLTDFSVFMQVHISPFPWQKFINKLASLGLISLATYLVFEIFLLTLFGTTLGKWLLRVTLRTDQGKKISFRTAIERTFLVYFRGLALLIPVISLFTAIYAYGALNSSGTTSWDKECHTTVSHQSIGIFRLLVFIILLIAFSDAKSRAANMPMGTMKDRLMAVCGLRG